MRGPYSGTVRGAGGQFKAVDSKGPLAAPQADLLQACQDKRTDLHPPLSGCILEGHWECEMWESVHVWEELCTVGLLEA